MELMVGEEVVSLGLTLDGAPPGNVVVESVEPLGWAESQGVPVGAVLLKADGDEVESMDEESFEICLNRRPLLLTLSAEDTMAGAECLQERGRLASTNAEEAVIEAKLGEMSTFELMV